MKRCPECRRDFYDDSLIFCLDDGTRLLDGPPSVDEPATALLHSTAAPVEAATRAQIDITNPTAVLSSPNLISKKFHAHSTELPDRPDLSARLRYAFRQRGWNGYLRELIGQTTDSFGSQTRRASILDELGEKEESLKSLEDGFERSDWWMFSIKYDPAFDSMRWDPRFQALVKKFEP